MDEKNELPPGRSYDPYPEEKKYTPPFWKEVGFWAISLLVLLGLWVLLSAIC